MWAVINYPNIFLKKLKYKILKKKKLIIMT